MFLLETSNPKVVPVRLCFFLFYLFFFFLFVVVSSWLFGCQGCINMFKFKKVKLQCSSY